MVPQSAIIVADFLLAYTAIIKEEEVGKALKKNSQQCRKFLKKIPGKKIDYAYAEGKWTIREVLQHIIDAERVFAYRALRFARKDATPLPGFDENTWAAQTKTSSRKWEDLVEEFKTVRRSTEMLFDSFNDDQLTFAGEANGHALNAVGVGFIIAGHAAHHIKILKERYL
jgi:hypothetical protein